MHGFSKWKKCWHLESTSTRNLWCSRFWNVHHQLGAWMVSQPTIDQGKWDGKLNGLQASMVCIWRACKLSRCPKQYLLDWGIYRLKCNQSLHPRWLEMSVAKVWPVDTKCIWRKGRLILGFVWLWLLYHTSLDSSGHWLKRQLYMYRVQTSRVAIILKKQLNFAWVNSMIFLRLSLNIVT